MKTRGRWIAVLALMAAACGQALAEPGTSGAGAQADKVGSWDRVGDSGLNGPAPAAASRAQAPGEGGLQARKAEMVRRMFWIMMAHR